MVFRVRYVAASLVSRRKVSRRFSCPNFTQPMLKYGRRSRVEIQKKNFLRKTSGNTEVRYARRRSKNDVTSRKARREFRNGACAAGPARERA